MSGAYLEIVEGPDAGRQLPVDREVTVGRDETADFALSDPHLSRRHCQVTPTDRGAIVRDLGSRNGTFVNNQEVVDSAELGAGDDLLVGVTVLQLRTEEPERTKPLSGVRAVPAGLRVPERSPDYVPEPVEPADEAELLTPDPTAELKPYLDVRVKGRTRLAPFFVLGLAGLFVLAYALTNGVGSPPDLKIVW